MDYRYEDFTTENYSRLLDIAKDRFSFTNFAEIDEEVRFVLWRHDIDCSPHRALDLAKIEYSKNVKSTYFVWLHSPMYHFFENEIVQILKKILNLGHDIGLHFDIGFYGVLNEVELEQKIGWEKQILEKVLGRKIIVFSYHGPGESFPNYDDFTTNDIADLYPHYFKSSICGLINTYGKYFRENVDYCSDSNGYWRFRRLQDVLESPEDEIQCLQVLTHPEWWVSKPMPPRARIQRCIDGRAKKTAMRYDQLLAKVGRENVG
jgi:peptidoglycan/xylan/chitin deacetylase (PgdA/CDA1 family)